MSANVKGIDRGALFDSDNKPIAGVVERLILWNLEDVSSYTPASSGNANIVEAILLKAGAQAFSFDGVRNSNIPGSDFIPGTFVSGYDHRVNFHVWDFTQNQKDNLERLAVQRVVALIQNSDDTFEIYGLNQGLELQEAPRNPGDTDTSGAFVIALKTSDNGAREPKYPQTFFKTDFASTLVLADALIRLPIVDNISPDSVLAAGASAVTVKGKNFFLNGVDDVTSVDWIQDDLTIVNEPGAVPTTDILITIASSAVLAAGQHTVRVTTAAGNTQGDGFPITAA